MVNFIKKGFRAVWNRFTRIEMILVICGALFICVMTGLEKSADNRKQQDIRTGVQQVNQLNAWYSQSEFSTDMVKGFSVSNDYRLYIRVDANAFHKSGKDTKIFSNDVFSEIVEQYPGKLTGFQNVTESGNKLTRNNDVKTKRFIIYE